MSTLVTGNGEIIAPADIMRLLPSHNDELLMAGTSRRGRLSWQVSREIVLTDAWEALLFSEHIKVVKAISRYTRRLSYEAIHLLDRSRTWPRPLYAPKSW